MWKVGRSTTIDVPFCWIKACGQLLVYLVFAIVTKKCDSCFQRSRDCAKPTSNATLNSSLPFTALPVYQLGCNSWPLWHFHCDLGFQGRAQIFWIILHILIRGCTSGLPDPYPSFAISAGLFELMTDYKFYLIYGYQWSSMDIISGYLWVSMAIDGFYSITRKLAGSMVPFTACQIS